jgi:uncharacterized protein
MMTDAMMAQVTLLASPAAPKAALSPLELDGYLTGVIIAPQAMPIPPSRWMAGLWDDADQVSEDSAQINPVFHALIGRHAALIRDIDRSLQRLERDNICDYRPAFLPREGKPAHDAVRRWVRGFSRAMALVPETWSAIAADKRAQVLLEPFAGFFDLSDLDPIEIPDNLDALLDDGAAAIPRMVLILRKLAKIRRSEWSHRRKVGRNEPCPCGSGEKYKRCCGEA